VFERSFYILLGPQWICVGGPTLGAGPLNILCVPSGEALSASAKLRVGDAVAIRDEALVAGGSTIMLRSAGHWGPASPETWGEGSLSRGLAALVGALPQDLPEQGLARLLRPDAATAFSPVLAAAQRPAWDLTQIVLTAKATRPIDGKYLVVLLGLGPGLTPSGDDYLGGALVALHATGQSELGRRLWVALQPHLATATGDISRAHLTAAAEGLGNAALHDLIGAILTADCANVREALCAAAATGHTSGWDAVAGAVAVLRATARSLGSGPSGS
jgi:hypothetical protein